MSDGKSLALEQLLEHINETIIIGSDRRSEPNNFRPPYDQIADANLTFTPCLSSRFISGNSLFSKHFK